MQPIARMKELMESGGKLIYLLLVLIMCSIRSVVLRLELEIIRTEQKSVSGTCRKSEVELLSSTEKLGDG